LSETTTEISDVGVYGIGAIGVRGVSTQATGRGGFGVFGKGSNVGVHGEGSGANSSGVFGTASSTDENDTVAGVFASVDGIGAIGVVAGSAQPGSLQSLPATTAWRYPRP